MRSPVPLRGNGALQPRFEPTNLVLVYTASVRLIKDSFDDHKRAAHKENRTRNLRCRSYVVDTTSLLELSDVTGKPQVKMKLPCPLRIGDRIQLRFSLRRQQGGRSEVLTVAGEVRVTNVNFDVSTGVSVQRLTVQFTGDTPSWRAVKKTYPEQRQSLSPARAPRTVLV
jgi:hypothetical protein